MLKAYAEGHWEGDLMEILGAEQSSFTIDNSAFPANWVESGIAQNCVINCTECGKCQQVLKQVLRKKQSDLPKYTLNLLFPDNTEERANAFHHSHFT